MDTREDSSAKTQFDLRAGDVSWGAELIDIDRARDIDTTVEFLEEMLTRLRKPAKAGRMLASAEPVLLREALGLAAPRLTSAR